MKPYISGDAFALATVLHRKSLKDIEDTVYALIDKGPYGSDERKADLYAQLVETLTADMRFDDMCAAIQAAMMKTAARFPHG